MPPRKDVWLNALRPRRRPVYSAWSRRLRGLSYLGAIALLAIGYRLLVILVYQFPLPPGLDAQPIWPPAAYNQLILLLIGLKFWPAVALGSLLNSTMTDGTPVGSLMAAANNTLQALLGAWLLLRANFSPRIDRLRDVGILVFLGGVIPSTFSATFGMAYFCLAGMVEWSRCGLTWFDWWMGNLGGILIWVPVILMLPECHKRLMRRKLFSLFWLVSLSAVSWFVFASTRMEYAPFPLEYLASPLILIGALRLGNAGAAFSILITTGFAAWGFIEGRGPFFVSANPTVAILSLQAYVCTVVVTVLSLTASIQERERARRDLQREKENSEKLLLNILPQPIATRLKLTNGTIADHFAEVTVLFADIVDFTHLSSELAPQSLVIMLNDIFSTFDALAEKHGLEKIKTIGDAYMVVGGLPEHRDDHAIAIAEMALDMQTAIAEFSQQHDRPFTMRIGINTGPVVAGVIGRKKFIYDLWGDTVNIASRMESSGMAGEIQVTQSTYQALKSTYQMESRGEIPIKGKGSMATYWLRDRHPVALSERQ